jgi:hypothetical protein
MLVQHRIGQGRSLAMNDLASLIADAVALAHPDETVHGGRLWRSIGGRACPIGWEHCSQPVFEDIRTGETDYGEPGGPGHADCLANCRERMRPPEAEVEEPKVSTLVFPTFRLAADAARRFTNALFETWPSQGKVDA